jgi:hypothetical protein
VLPEDRSRQRALLALLFPPMAGDARRLVHGQYRRHEQDQQAARGVNGELDPRCTKIGIKASADKSIHRVQSRNDAFQHREGIAGAVSFALFEVRAALSHRVGDMGQAENRNAG